MLSMIKQPLGGDRRVPPLDLLQVQAPREVGMVLMIEAVVRGVGEHPLLLPRQVAPPPARSASSNESMLEATRHLVLVVRVRAPDRIAEHEDGPGVREQLGDPLRSEWMERVVRTAFAGDDLARRSAPLADAAWRRWSGNASGTTTGPSRSWCRSSGCPCSVTCRHHRGMLLQVPVQRGRPAALRADDQEVGKLAERKRRHSPCAQPPSSRPSVRTCVRQAIMRAPLELVQEPVRQISWTGTPATRPSSTRSERSIRNSR